jgi:hypothetical protein
MGTVELELWSWKCGTRTVELELWKDLMELELWNSGT